MHSVTVRQMLKLIDDATVKISQWQLINPRERSSATLSQSAGDHSEDRAIAHSSKRARIRTITNCLRLFFSSVISLPGSTDDTNIPVIHTNGLAVYRHYFYDHNVTGNMLI